MECLSSSVTGPIPSFIATANAIARVLVERLQTPYFARRVSARLATRRRTDASMRPWVWCVATARTLTCAAPSQTIVGVPPLPTACISEKLRKIMNTVISTYARNWGNISKCFKKNINVTPEKSYLKLFYFKDL